MSVKTHGVECSDNAKCRDHVDEKHVYWTFDGPHTWPQSIILHNIKKIRNRVRGNARGEYSSERFECEEDNNKNCILCPSKYHLWHTCKYDTPEKRRKRLRQVGRCQSCLTLVEEHGLVCSHRARCIYHPGERHNTLTCSGSWFKHPGPQKIIDDMLFKNGWRDI